MTIAKKSIAAAALFMVLGLAQFALLSPSPASADDSLFNGQTGMTEIGRLYGDQKQDIRITVMKFIVIALTFIGSIFLVLAIYAGFQYMTAGGNEEQTKKAIALLKNAVIGIIIILMAWAITRYALVMLQRAINNKVDYTTYY